MSMSERPSKSSSNDKGGSPLWIPKFSLSNFLVERRVTIKSPVHVEAPISINGTKIQHEEEPRNHLLLPLQIYHGSAVTSVARRPPIGQYYSLKEQMQPIIKDRAINKQRAESRASQPLDARKHLKILYHDDHICVCNKLSGVLSAPGPRRNPSLAQLVHDAVKPDIDIDQMIVHRLDMDTSGIIVYALTLPALRKLHIDFKERRVKKTYQALVAGHFGRRGVGRCLEVEIDLLLERDPFNPPFMRIANDQRPQIESKKGSINDGGQSTNGNCRVAVPKFLEEPPKACLTEMQVQSLEYLAPKRNSNNNFVPVTRVTLVPLTGRTHQLRVHCQAIGYPIIGDDIYGETENDDETTLCLHAQKLCIYHPYTGAPMIFQTDPPF